MRNPRPLAAALLLSIGSFHLSAQSQSATGTPAESWQFTMEPYLMLPWMNGTTALKGTETKVNASPSDIFSNLQFGVMGSFEARKSRWGLGTDAVYMALGTTLSRDPILGDRANADVDVNQGAYTFQGLRRLNATTDLVFGVRWNVIQQRLGLKGPLQTVVEGTQQWVDPIVGLKIRYPIKDKWHFTMQGDIGGFGAGSKFAWELFPVVGVDVSRKATLGVGYRVLSMNYKTGSTDYFKYDVVTQAFVLGAAFHF